MPAALHGGGGPGGPGPGQGERVVKPKPHNQLPLLAALLLAPSMLAPPPASAQGEEQLPVGPRPLAMGGAFSALASGPDALWWNPAGLAQLPASQLRGVTADLHGLGIRDNLLTLASPLGDRWGAALEWYHSGFDDGSLSDGLDRLHLATGYAPHRRVRVGAGLKYRQYRQSWEGLEAGRGHGFGLDLGAQLLLPVRLAAGLVWRDVGGSSLDYDDGRSSEPYDDELRAGLAWSPLANLALAADLGRDAHLGAEFTVARTLDLRAGWTKDLDGLDDPRLSLGFGLRYGPARVDYAFVDHPMLDPTHHFGVGMDFTLAPRRVELVEAQLQPVFASFHKVYASRPAGRLVVRNLEEEPVELTVRVVQERLLDGPTERTLWLRPGAAEAIDLTLLFGPGVMELQEARHHNFDLELSYPSGGRVRREARRLDAFVYQPGTLDWDGGVAPAGAFVTPQDPVVDRHARELLQRSADGAALGLGPRLDRAARLFDALSGSGLEYTPDPLNPYGELAGARVVDTIQYPRQYLLSGSGDCDDSSVLYASLLENVGIPTALVDVPGHIFLLFDSGLRARDRQVLGVDPQLFVVRDDALWVPVETTALGEPFSVAWRRGAELWQSRQAAGQAKVVDTARARADYPAALPAGGYDDSRRAVPQPEALASLRGRTREDMGQWKAQWLAAREGAGGGRDDALLLARAFYLNRDFERAAGELLAVPEAGRDAVVWNNLGAARFAKGEAHTARDDFARARALDPDDPGIALNHGLALRAVGEIEAAEAELAAVVAQSGGVAGALDLLGLRLSAGDGARADENTPELRSLAQLEQLLAQAAEALPRGAASVADSTLLRRLGLGAAADSLGVDQAGDSLLSSPTTGDSARQPGEGRQLRTEAGASRGSQIAAEDIVDLLYWKEG